MENNEILSNFRKKLEELEILEEELYNLISIDQIQRFHDTFKTNLSATDRFSTLFKASLIKSLEENDEF